MCRHTQNLFSHAALRCSYDPCTLHLATKRWTTCSGFVIQLLLQADIRLPLSRPCSRHIGSDRLDRLHLLLHRTHHCMPQPETASNKCICTMRIQQPFQFCRDDKQLDNLRDHLGLTGWEVQNWAARTSSHKWHSAKCGQGLRRSTLPRKGTSLPYRWQACYGRRREAMWSTISPPSRPPLKPNTAHIMLGHFSCKFCHSEGVVNFMCNGTC